MSTTRRSYKHNLTHERASPVSHARIGGGLWQIALKRVSKGPLCTSEWQGVAFHLQSVVSQNNLRFTLSKTRVTAARCRASPGEMMRPGRLALEHVTMEGLRSCVHKQFA